MVIKFLRGAFHLGYAYRAGDVAVSLPEEVCKELIEGKYAIEHSLRKRPEKKPEKAKVQTTDIKRDKER